MESSRRYLAVDAYRGLIMILMAIDHSSGLIARQHGREFWAGAMSEWDAAFPFLTRWITHLCAPGFFFLMGAGIYWFAAKRRAGEAGSTGRIVFRGFIIFALGQLFEGPLLFITAALVGPAVSLNRITAAPPNDGSSLYWGMLTLSGLGLVMMVCGVLLRLRPWAWLVISGACLVATEALLPSSGRPLPWWGTILLTPGISDHLLVVYPLIPWLAGAAAGMYFAHWWQADADRAKRQIGFFGLGALLTGMALRAAGGWGNIRPARDSGWIEFLNNVKYPPSAVFWTMSLGIGLLVIAAFLRWEGRLTSSNSPLIVFGQTPLFFYVLHFAVFTACAFAFFRQPASLEGAWVMWAVVVAALYPLCRWYRTFKLNISPDSLWRLL